MTIETLIHIHTLLREERDTADSKFKQEVRRYGEWLHLTGISMNEYRPDHRYPGNNDYWQSKERMQKAYDALKEFAEKQWN